MKTAKTVGFIALTAFAGSVLADNIMTGKVTADNHYAIYTKMGSDVSYIGGNELGAAGNPGTYNWSMAESWSFTPGTAVYIAAWSDKSVAQGLLADFSINGVPIRSGSEGWDVFGTGIDMNDGSAHPDAALIKSQVAHASHNFLWQLPYVGDQNMPSTQPWGKIDGISQEARWIWNGTDGNTNPLVGGGNADEMLIFRFFVPSPGTMACAGLGATMLLRRRR